MLLDDEYFMRQALREAEKAYEAGEIPVGAAVVSEGRILAKAHNQTVLLEDATAHAEMLAFSAAFEYLGARYLSDCTLYVTLEPCPMCAGAAYWSQVSRIVYGAADEKRGYARFGPGMLHPKTKVESGLLERECQALLQAFFKGLRG